MDDERLFWVVIGVRDFLLKTAETRRRENDGGGIPGEGGGAEQQFFFVLFSFGTWNMQLFYY